MYNTLEAPFNADCECISDKVYDVFKEDEDALAFMKRIKKDPRESQDKFIWDQMYKQCKN